MISYEPEAGRATSASPPVAARRLAFSRVGQRSSGLAAALGFLLAQLWFSPGRFLAAGDIPPFQTEGLRAELFNLWSHQSTGDGSAGYVVARWPEVFVSVVVRGLGFGGPVAQRIFLGGCVALCAGALAWAMATVVRRRFLIVVSSLLVILSPLTITSLPSHLTFVASAGAALGAGVGLRAWQAHPIPWWPWVALAVTCGLLTVNPPLLIVVIVWGAACLGLGIAVSPGPERRRTLLRVLSGVAAASVLSAYWVVPFAFTILRPSESSSFVAQTDVSQWAWTHARASILNVLSLTGHWSWDHPEYHPIVSVLDQRPIAWTRYGLPLTALVAPFLATGRRRRLSLALVGAVGVLVFVGKGLHTPFGGVNRYLYDNLPGFWLLREPVPKASAVLLPVLAVLWAIALDGLADRALVPGRAQQLFMPVATAAVASSLVFGTPLVSGRALEQLPGQTLAISVPDEWAAAAAAVDRSPSSGKVVQLPLADYYQLPTTWGYYGADAALSGLARRPVLTRSPGGYFASRSVADRLLGEVERGVLDGDGPKVEEAMRRLGASILVVRSDLKEDSENRSFAPAAPLVVGLGKLPGVQTLHEGPLVRVVEMPGVGLASTYGVVQRGSDPGVTLAPDVASLATNAPGLGPEGDELEGGVLVRGSADGVAVESHQRGAHVIKVASGLPLDFTAEPRADRLALVPQSKLEVDGRPSPVMAELDLGAAAAVRALRTGDRVIDLAASPATLQIASGSKLEVLRSAVHPQRLAEGALADCARSDARSLEEVGIAVEARPDGDVLSAREHRACLRFEAAVPRGAGALQLVVLGRAQAGVPAPPCVLIDLSTACAPPTDDEVLADGSQRLTLALPEGAASITLFEYADPGNPVTWQRPTLEWLTTLSAIAVPDAQAVVDLEPGTHQVSVTGSGGSQLGEHTGVNNCGGTASPVEAGMSLEDTGDGFSLRAEQQRACTTIPVKNLAEEVAIQFQVRGGRAASGGYCLWWDVLKRCAKADSFEVGEAWRTVDIEVEVPPGVTEGRLFLYASPGIAGDASVTYRSIAVRNPRSISLTVGPAVDRERPPAASPVLTKRRGGGAAIEVPPRPHPVLVRFAEGYSSSWKGTIGGREVPHAQVDGFVNGWVVPRSDKPLTLEIRYGPQRWADLAVAASGLAFLCLVVGWAVGHTRPRRSSRRATDASSPS